MSDNWNCYICKVNDKLASIFVDIGARKTAPDEGRRWLLWVWLYFKKPRPDGLSSQEEFETLIKLEDKLVADLKLDCDAVLTGRITTCGRREFYFYSARPDGFREAVRTSLASFRGYNFDCDTRQDPGWTQYLNVLYPTEEQFQLIGNRDLLDTMKRNGDSLATAREVRHWIYFQDMAGRERFKITAQSLGYRIESESQNVESERQYEIQISRMQDLSSSAIDESVTELFRASKSADGEYDGWECELIVDANHRERLE